MWKQLPESRRKEYKKLVLAFASLSRVFAQKTEEEASIIPIINSKYQETVFQRAFSAKGEDIGNTSYDASLELLVDGIKKKYLVGIKTFGFSSGDQKIAQFKSFHDRWSDTINMMSLNAKGKKSKKEIDKVNEDLYARIAIEIADIRNQRIKTAEANLQGFSIVESGENVEAVYHVLMPSEQGGVPEIIVGETPYTRINKERLQILGCTSAKNPTNFVFKDDQHKYKFTAADSQLLMSFDNKDIIVEKWRVKYVDDAFTFFEEIASKVYGKESREGVLAQEVIPKPHVVESYSWKIKVERYSGFNSFYGVGSKITFQNREQRINALRKKYSDHESFICGNLKPYLLTTATSEEERENKEILRERIVSYVGKQVDSGFREEVLKTVFRPIDEMYIPIPNSRNFHDTHPDFFGPGIGTFVEGTSKLAKDKDQCRFKLVFEPSGQEMDAFITQDNGKAIESWEKQSIMGKWLREYVFGLEEYQPLTERRLKEIGINGIRLFKVSDSDSVHLQFIEIEDENPPADCIN